MISLLAGILSGIIASMGLGGGAVLLIYLALIKEKNQLDAQGENLMFFIPVALLSVIIYAVRKQIKWKIVLPLAVMGVIGAAVGFWLSGLIDSKLLTKIFGGLLALIGVWQIISALKATSGQS